MSQSEYVFAVPGGEALAARLVSGMNASQGILTVRSFPDGETYVRGETPCDGRDVLLAANLFRPNANCLPLFFCAQAVRVMGAKRVFLVAPYLPYMRQDARFQPGEVVTSRVFAKLLSGAVDGLVTVDPHLHRYNDLSELYSIPSRVQHAAPSIAAWIRTHVNRPIIVGPDRESEQWVSEVADSAGAPCVILTKTRRGDRDVSIDVPPLARWQGYVPVLVDDIISTANTMAEAVGHLIRAGYAKPVCIGVHAVFADDAFENLKRAGAAQVVTCDSVPHPTNAISLTNTVVTGIRDLIDVSVPVPGAQEKRQ
ncbi:MAG: ribose-phosphate pyrophosphokinase [Burkholderiaceae bacterium]